MAVLLETKTKKWGNSLGVIIPSEVVVREKLKENEKVELLLVRDSRVLKETFGALKGKWKKSGQQIKDGIRAELYE